jgi:hypothetical protein
MGLARHQYDATASNPLVRSTGGVAWLHHAHYATSIGTSSGALLVTISAHGGGIFIILVFSSFLRTTYLFSNVFFG